MILLFKHLRRFKTHFCADFHKENCAGTCSYVVNFHQEAWMKRGAEGRAKGESSRHVANGQTLHTHVPSDQ